MKRHLCSLTVVILLSAFALAQYGCGGGGGGGGASASSSSGTAVNGSIQAPGGVIAFDRPFSLRRMLARFFVGDAAADNPGVAPVGAGVTVNLVQIDNNGNQVAILATTTTDASGNYTLTAPAGFTGGASYVVEAAGSSLTLRSFVTGTTVNVDPYTHATVTLITGAVSTASSAIAAVSSADVAAVQQTVLQTSGDITTTSSTATQMVSGLTTKIQNDVESNNIVTSIGSPGSITGNVVDSNSAAVAGAQIMVRTFGNQTTQAITRTDASGNYTVHVPAGDYIVGVINDTATSTAASQWWTATGGTPGQFGAGKVTVASTAVTINFSLIPGGRISGTVTAGSSTTTLAGIYVTLCDYVSGQTLMFVRTSPDGTYNFNVAPGTYWLSFRNSTLAPYATGCYNGSAGGGANKTQAQKLTVTAGSSTTANMALMLGNMISGSVTDPTTGAVAGMAMRFQDSTGALAESMRTSIDGTYRMWVQPGSYNILTRGQIASAVNASAGNVTQNFASTVGMITATITDGTNPVSGVFAYLYDTTASNNLVGYEVTNGDGTVTVYAPPATGHVILSILVDNGRPLGTNTYYGNATLTTPTRIPAGTQIVVPAGGSTTALGSLALTTGQVLSGVVTNTVGGAPIGNSIVQVRIAGGFGGGYRIASERTTSDGSYSISLPAGISISRVLACLNTLSPGNQETSGPSSSGDVAGQYAWTASFTMSGSTTENLSY